MIFADKLIQLRKKSGWSQEELAIQLNVSRQSVSKWEGAQSIPDLNKMIRLSELFQVSIDYLLKDEIEEVELISSKEDISPIKCVSMEEASAFLHIKEVTAKSIAFATYLCILSPIFLIILSAVSEIPKYHLSGSVADGIGIIVFLVFVTIAIAIFISSGSKTAAYEYLEKEVFETEYGVSGMVKERKERYKNTFTRNIIIGTCICILSLIPFFIGEIINKQDEVLLMIMLSIGFVLAGVGITFFIRSGIVWESFDKLLQEGDYSRHKKELNSITTAISTVYWLIVTAIYFAYSFATHNWKYSWVIWIIAGILYPAIATIFNTLLKKIPRQVCNS